MICGVVATSISGCDVCTACTGRVAGVGERFFFCKCLFRNFKRRV